MSELNELIARVEALSGADREVDCRLWVVLQGGDSRMHYFDAEDNQFVWERGIDGFWVRDVVSVTKVKSYTASTDAALAFSERVLPGWKRTLCTWHSEHEKPWSDCASLGFIMSDEGCDSQRAEASAPTLPLAIILATLKAKAAE